MIIRSYYNESGDTWVCVLQDNDRAFVARRNTLISLNPLSLSQQWSLSYRRWKRQDGGMQKLLIKELGKFDTIEQAQQAIGISIERATYIFYSSSNSPVKTFDTPSE